MTTREKIKKLLRDKAARGDMTAKSLFSKLKEKPVKKTRSFFPETKEPDYMGRGYKPESYRMFQTEPKELEPYKVPEVAKEFVKTQPVANAERLGFVGGLKSGMEIPFKSKTMGLVEKVPEAIHKGTAWASGKLIKGLGGLVGGITRFAMETNKLGYQDIFTKSSKDNISKIWKDIIQGAKETAEFGEQVGQAAPTAAALWKLKLLEPLFVVSAGFGINKIFDEVENIYYQSKVQGEDYAGLRATEKGLKEGGSQGFQSILGFDKKDADEMVENESMASLGNFLLYGVVFKGTTRTIQGMPFLKTKPTGNTIIIPADQILKMKIRNNLAKTEFQTKITKDGIEITLPKKYKLTPEQIEAKIKQMPYLEGNIIVREYQKTPFGKLTSPIGEKSKIIVGKYVSKRMGIPKTATSDKLALETPIAPSPVIRSLITKFEKMVADEQMLIKSGQATPEIIEQVKKQKAVIDNLKTKLLSAPQIKLLLSQRIVEKKPVEKPIKKIEPIKKPVVRSVEKIKLEDLPKEIRDRIQKKVEPKSNIKILYQGTGMGSLRRTVDSGLKSYELSDEMIKNSKGGNITDKVIKKLKQIQNNPNAEIIIYRGSPKDSGINNGDWITLDKKRAEVFTKTRFGSKIPNYEVQELKVKAKDIIPQKSIRKNKIYDFLYQQQKSVGRPKTGEVTTKEALEARKKIKAIKPKQYKDYRVVEKPKETQEQIRKRLAEEREAVAKRRGEGVFTEKEKRLGISNENKVLYDELKMLKKRGKEEMYFHDLVNKYYLDFLDGKTKFDKSEIVSKFINENFDIVEYKPIDKTFIDDEDINTLPQFARVKIDDIKIVRPEVVPARIIKYINAFRKIFQEFGKIPFDYVNKGLSPAYVHPSKRILINYKELEADFKYLEKGKIIEIPGMGNFVANGAFPMEENLLRYLKIILDHEILHIKYNSMSLWEQRWKAEELRNEVELEKVLNKMEEEVYEVLKKHGDKIPVSFSLLREIRGFENISKEFILNLINRYKKQGLSQFAQDKIKDSLNEFKGKKVNVTEFFKKVDEKNVNIQLNSIKTRKYTGIQFSDYGTKLLDKDPDKYKALVFRLPYSYKNNQYNYGINAHFKEYKDYFSHVRGYVDKDTFYIEEIQSDFVQRNEYLQTNIYKTKKVEIDYLVKNWERRIIQEIINKAGLKINNIAIKLEDLPSKTKRKLYFGEETKHEEGWIKKEKNEGDYTILTKQDKPINKLWFFKIADVLKGKKIKTYRDTKFKKKNEILYFLIENVPNILSYNYPKFLKVFIPQVKGNNNIEKLRSLVKLVRKSSQKITYYSYNDIKKYVVLQGLINEGGIGTTNEIKESINNVISELSPELKKAVPAKIIDPQASGYYGGIHSDTINRTMRKLKNYVNIIKQGNRYFYEVLSNAQTFPKPQQKVKKETFLQERDNIYKEIIAVLYPELAKVKVKNYIMEFNEMKLYDGSIYYYMTAVPIIKNLKTWTEKIYNPKIIPFSPLYNRYNKVIPKAIKQLGYKSKQITPHSDKQKYTLIENIKKEGIIELPSFIRKKNERGFIIVKQLIEAPFKVISLTSTTANALDKAWQYMGGKILNAALGDKIYNNLQNIGSLFSDIKIKVGSGKNIHVFYPFEFLTGARMKEVLGPYKVDYNKVVAGIKQEAIDLGKYLNKFTSKEQEIIVEKIVNANYTKDELGVAALKVEEKFSELGWQLVEKGLMPEEVFKEYLGRYFPRMFKEFEQTQDWIRTQRLTKLDLEYTKLKKDAYGVKYRERKKPITKKFGSREERDLFAQDLKEQGIKYDTFSPVSESKRQELVEIKSLPYPVVKRMIQEGIDIKKVDYFNTIAKNKRIVRKEQDVDAGFVNQIPNVPKYGAIADMYIHQHYINDFKGMVELPTQVDSFFRFANSIAKGMKTIVDTGVTTANMISNFFLADLGGVPLERIDYWIRNLYNALQNKGAYNKLFKAGQIGKTMAGEELQTFLGIDKDIEKFKASFIVAKDSSFWDIACILFNLVKKGWLKAGDLYSFSEDWAKSTCFDWAVNEMGMSEKEAMQFAQDTIFDYSQVSRFLHLLRRSPMGAPFPTFVAKMTNVAIKTQIKKPFTIAKWYWLLGTASALTLSQHGITEDDIKRIKPEWIGSWFLVGDVERDKRGKVIDIQLQDMSRYFPWGQMTTMPIGIDSWTDLIMQPKMGGFYKFRKEKGQGFLSAWEPGGILIKPIFETFFNYSEFFGEEIFDENASPMEKMFKITDYLSRAWGPSWMPLIVPEGKGGHLFNKLYSAFTNQSDFWGRRYSIMEAFLRMIGTKITHIDPQLQFDFQYGDLKKQYKNYSYKLQSEQTRYRNAMKRENTDETKSKAEERWLREKSKLESKLQRLLDMEKDLRVAEKEFFKHTDLKNIKK